MIWTLSKSSRLSVPKRRGFPVKVVKEYKALKRDRSQSRPSYLHMKGVLLVEQTFSFTFIAHQQISLLLRKTNVSVFEEESLSFLLLYTTFMMAKHQLQHVIHSISQ